MPFPDAVPIPKTRTQELHRSAGCPAVSVGFSPEAWADARSACRWRGDRFYQGHAGRTARSTGRRPASRRPSRPATKGVPTAARRQVAP